MDTKPQSYKDLLVWQKGIELAKLIYQLTDEFPAAAKFGLVAQLRRATVSVPSNIAEGQARRTTGDFVQFISNAEGSIAEIDAQLILAIELNFCRAQNASDAFALIIELKKMLNALRRKLGSRN